MKKMTILLFIIPAVFSACRKEVTREDPGDQAYAAVRDIKPSDWITEDDSVSFYTSFDIPQLSDAVFDHGAVIIYLSFDDNIYEALPEVYEGITYGAIHSQGAATVDMHALDGSRIIPPGGDVYAKIVLIDAQQLSLHPGVNLQDFQAVRKAFHIQ